MKRGWQLSKHGYHIHCFPKSPIGDDYGKFLNYDYVLLPEAMVLDHSDWWSKWSVAKLRNDGFRGKIYARYDLNCKRDNTNDETDGASNPCSWDYCSPLKTKNGVNIHTEDPHVILLDVGSAGYKEHYLQNLLTHLNWYVYQGIDGIVFDMWDADPTRFLTWMGLTWDDVQQYSSASLFFIAWIGFIQYLINGIRAAKPDLEIVGNNCGRYGETSAASVLHRDLVDAVIYENFLYRFSTETEHGYRSKNDVMIEMMQLQRDPKPVWVTEEGLKAGESFLETGRIASLAAYYIALPYSWNTRRKRAFSYYGEGDSSVVYDDWWDIYLGDPSSPPLKNTKLCAWYRVFNGGRVYLNWDDVAVSWNLPTKNILDIKTMERPDNMDKRRVFTLPPKTGAILIYE